MIHQKVRVKEGVEIEIIMPKVPYRIINRAEQLITKILFNDILTGMRPKVIQRNKNWLSYRINRKYRLLVMRTCSHTGPYYCMSHNEFDHWVNSH